jgi:natural product precursor
VLNNKFLDEMKKLKKIKLECSTKEQIECLSNSGMNRIRGGYTLSTTTVTPSGGSNDGDDGIMGD